MIHTIGIGLPCVVMGVITIGFVIYIWIKSKDKE